MSLLSQGNGKFERMLAKGKGKSDKIGLGYSHQKTTYAQGVKNGFMRNNNKAKVISSAPRGLSHNDEGKSVMLRNDQNNNKTFAKQVLGYASTSYLSSISCYYYG